jgi:hypothetical protein
LSGSSPPIIGRAKGETVNLDDFATEQGGIWSRSVARVPDVTGQETHQLIIEGPPELVRQTLAESSFDVEIDPRITQEEWEQRLAEQVRAQPETPTGLDEVDRLAALFKEPPGRSTPYNSVVVTLERLQRGGTGFLFVFPLFVPTGVSLFFVLPPVCTCSGTVFPASGDPDLFLTVNGLGPPTVAASTLGGTAVDSVSFTSLFSCIPFFGFVPFLRVLGFRASTCVLVWGGFGLP